MLKVDTVLFLLSPEVSRQLAYLSTNYKEIYIPRGNLYDIIERLLCIFHCDSIKIYTKCFLTDREFPAVEIRNFDHWNPNGISCDESSINNFRHAAHGIDVLPFTGLLCS